MGNLTSKWKEFRESKESKRVMRGSLSDLGMDIIIFIAVLFIGVLAISLISGVTAINNSSAFFSIQTAITVGTSQMYMVLIAAGVITVIGVILMVIKNFGARAGPGGGV